MTVNRKSRNLVTWHLVTLWVWLSCAPPVNAEVYRWLDDEGHVHFGDCPPAAREASPVEIAPGPTPEQVEEAKARTRQLQERLRELELEMSSLRIPDRAPGSTGACLTLQRVIMRLLWLVDLARDRTCSSRQILDTAVVEVTAGAEPKVIERWTINRCGERVDYLVEFTTSPQGRTSFTIKVAP